MKRTRSWMICQPGPESALSADDGGRGKEVTITGSGFNDGKTAEAFVLVADTKPVDENGDDDCMALDR